MVSNDNNTRISGEENLSIDSLLKFSEVSPDDMTLDDWFEDFLSFYDLMKKNYPYFSVNERTLGYKWLDFKEKHLTQLRGAKNVSEILTVFWDAVTALQDDHTSIWLPQWMSYFFREDSYFQQREPYKTIFSDVVREASEYWKPIMENNYAERNGLRFEVLILYSKGDYLIIDGQGSWDKKYGCGTKVIAVHGTPIDIAIKDTYEKGILKWDFHKKKLYQLSIEPKHFGAKAVFTLETTQGEKKEAVFDASIDYKYNNVFNYPTEWLTTRIWSSRNIAYIKFRNFELDNVDEQMHDYLLAFYKQVKDYDHLIIDVRGNSGGWKDVWIENIIAPLINEKITSRMYVGFRKGEYVNLFRQQAGIDKTIEKSGFDYLPPEVLTDDFTVYDRSITVEPSTDWDFNAKITLLIDNQTWSASEGFALFSKETGFATLYGTPTKGEAVSTGTIFYVLPNSKIVIRFNPCLGIDSSGNSCEEAKVQPDIYYESEIRNQNELIDYVLKELRS
jgi:C-terminal processing protease CtpA/Prc